MPHLISEYQLSLPPKWASYDERKPLFVRASAKHAVVHGDDARPPSAGSCRFCSTMRLEIEQLGKIQIDRGDAARLKKLKRMLKAHKVASHRPRHADDFNLLEFKQFGVLGGVGASKEAAQPARHTARIATKDKHILELLELKEEQEMQIVAEAKQRAMREQLQAMSEMRCQKREEVLKLPVFYHSNSTEPIPLAVRQNRRLLAMEHPDASEKYEKMIKLALAMESSEKLEELVMKDEQQASAREANERERTEADKARQAEMARVRMEKLDQLAETKRAKEAHRQQTIMRVMEEDRHRRLALDKKREERVGQVDTFLLTRISQARGLSPQTPLIFQVSEAAKKREARVNRHVALLEKEVKRAEEKRVEVYQKLCQRHEVAEKKREKAKEVELSKKSYPFHIVEHEQCPRSDSGVVERARNARSEYLAKHTEKKELRLQKQQRQEQNVDSMLSERVKRMRKTLTKVKHMLAQSAERRAMYREEDQSHTRMVNTAKSEISALALQKRDRPLPPPSPNTPPRSPHRRPFLPFKEETVARRLALEADEEKAKAERDAAVQEKLALAAIRRKEYEMEHQPHPPRHTPHPPKSGQGMVREGGQRAGADTAARVKEELLRERVNRIRSKAMLRQQQHEANMEAIEAEKEARREEVLAKHLSPPVAPVTTPRVPPPLSSVSSPPASDQSPRVEVEDLDRELHARQKQHRAKVSEAAQARKEAAVRRLERTAAKRDEIAARSLAALEASAKRQKEKLDKASAARQALLDTQTEVLKESWACISERSQLQREKEAILSEMRAEAVTSKGPKSLHLAPSGSESPSDSPSVS